jgi:hypothetical protein
MLSRMNVTAPWIVVGALSLAGCSLLYSPNNLPAPAIDATVPPDLYVTMHPDLLTLDAAGPMVLFEGQGTGGSRPAILAITGSNIADDATVALLPTGGQSPAPMIEVDNAHAGHAPGVLAVPVTLPIDTSRGTAGASDVALTVQVTQMAPPGSGAPAIVKSLEGQVVLRNLPELDAPVTSSAALAPLYSRVALSSALSFTPGAAAGPAVIRAVSSISAGDVHADAQGASPGPGGAGGGAASTRGAGPGGGNPAALLSGGLLEAGSGGGYGSVGGSGGSLLNPTSNPGGPATGDELITSYASSAGSGGGGGNSNSGGGAGGTLELTAGGTLTVGRVTANGGAGSGNGGGGSGGAIVLRSGAVAMFGAITAGGGGVVSGSGAGGGGSGRLRYDVPSVGGAIPTLPTANRRGAAFLEAIPLVTNDPRQTLQLISIAASDLSFKVFVLDAAGITTEATMVTFAAPAVAIKPTLNAGYNRVCVTPPQGNPTLAESTSCIDIAYVP